MLWCGTVDIDSFEFRPKSSHTLRMPLHTRDKNSHIFAQIRPSPKWIRWHLLLLRYPKGSCHIVQSIAKTKKTLETYNPPNPSPSSLLHKQSQPWQTSSMQHYYETFKRRRKMRKTGFNRSNQIYMATIPVPPTKSRTKKIRCIVWNTSTVH